MLISKLLLILSKLSNLTRLIVFGLMDIIIAVMSFNKTTSSFVREGLFLDCLQKLSIDKFLKRASVTTIQLFDLNLSKVIRFLLDDVYKKHSSLFFKGDEASIFNVFVTLLLSFLIVFQVLFVLYLLLVVIF